MFCCGGHPFRGCGIHGTAPGAAFVFPWENRNAMTILPGQLKKPAARGWSPGASLSRLIGSLRTRQLKMSRTSVLSNLSLIGSIAARSMSCRATRAQGLQEIREGRVRARMGAMGARAQWWCVCGGEGGGRVSS